MLSATRWRGGQRRGTGRAARSDLAAAGRPGGAEAHGARKKKTAIIIAGGLALAAVAAGGVLAGAAKPRRGGRTAVGWRIDPDAVLSPKDVLNAVGDRVTVEFTVGLVKRDGSGAPLREARRTRMSRRFGSWCWRMTIRSDGQRGSSWPDALQGAKLRLAAR